MREGASLCDPQRPDLITPARIEHLLDELIQDGDASEMTLFGPFARETLLREVEDPALEAAVMDYARRRFPTVKKGGEA